MPKNIRPELRFNRDNFNSLLDQRAEARQKILSLENNVKKLNGEILMLKQGQIRTKTKSVQKKEDKNSPWNGIVKTLK